MTWEIVALIGTGFVTVSAFIFKYFPVKEVVNKSIFENCPNRNEGLTELKLLKKDIKVLDEKLKEFKKTSSNHWDEIDKKLENITDIMLRGK